MMAVNLKKLMCIYLSLLANNADGDSIQPASYSIHLSEVNWRDILEGEWFVEFMAPWCPECVTFQETWDSLAQKWNKDRNIQVAVVDITESPGLRGRLLVTALPSICHVKNGQFRFCIGSRSVTNLITYIEDMNWKDVEPVSQLVSPDSIQMKMVGQLFKLGMNIWELYMLMTEEYGIPEWGCYVLFAALTIVAGLVLGMVLVCIYDFVIARRPFSPPPQDLMNAEMDEEEDLIDDTQEDRRDVDDIDNDNDDTDTDGTHTVDEDAEVMDIHTDDDDAEIMDIYTDDSDIEVRDTDTDDGDFEVTDHHITDEEADVRDTDTDENGSEETDDSDIEVRSIRIDDSDAETTDDDSDIEVMNIHTEDGDAEVRHRCIQTADEKDI